MTATENQTPANADGRHEFSMNYSEREVRVIVDKDGDKLNVQIDGNLRGELKIQPDGSVEQTGGDTIPGSNIEYIKKHVLGQDK